MQNSLVLLVVPYLNKDLKEMKNLKFFVFFLTFLIISCAPPQRQSTNGKTSEIPGPDDNISTDGYLADSGDIDPSTLTADQLAPEGDADGDGTPNNLDPMPLNPNIGGTDTGGSNALATLGSQTVGSLLNMMPYFMMMSMMQKRNTQQGMTSAGVGMNTPTCVQPGKASGNALISDDTRLLGATFRGAQGEITFAAGKYERKLPQGSSKGTYSIPADGTLILKPNGAKCVLVYALTVEDGKCMPLSDVANPECPDAKNPCKSFDPAKLNKPEAGTISQIQMAGVPTTKNAELSSGHFSRAAGRYKCNSMAPVNPRTIASFSGGTTF